ncbi:MAG: MoxR family ATPase [Planctomycetes bacterium]|nr:MoxR family ATPase [Planctomycetota bacterium]
MSNKNIDFSKESQQLEVLRAEIGKVIVGQEDLVERLILAFLCNGHVLIEGIPGLAKTLTVNTLAQSLDATFSRIQFTPDLLPGDLTGTMIYNPGNGEFSTHQGPIFAHIVLADEINRSPAKVQSALLEAMQEKQVTLGGKVFTLPSPFLVLATQNPIEQEGTYPLPEAQVDRFMFKLRVSYPTFDEEHEVLKRMSRTDQKIDVKQVLSLESILEMRKKLELVHMDSSLEKYILHIVNATRKPAEYGLDQSEMIRFGASPRASIFMSLASRGEALLKGRSYVIPEDIKSVSLDILRHRIALSYKAEAKKVSSDHLIQNILDTVSIP